MIYPDKITGEFIEALNKNNFFSGKKIVRAFPMAVKPTLLSAPVIAIGIKEMLFDEASVGESVKRGSIGISADIYIPFLCSDVSAEKIVCEICKSVNFLGITAISVSNTAYDMKTQCLSVKTVFTFNGEFMLGGNDE